MLSTAQNELITKTDAGTPCGDLMRRYWQPVALSEELSASEPLAVRILGEDLVLFRGEKGDIGLMQRLCPHRGADLSYGRVEDGGLRCIYHGWLFASGGKCLQQPGEPPVRSFADRLPVISYPCREAGSLILTYMGPGEPPPLPALPFFNTPDDDRVFTTKMLHECNYLQASEGNVDPQHLSYLHRFLTDETSLMPELNRLLMADAAPELRVRHTGFGLEILAVRDLPDGNHYVRITNFIMPNGSAFDGIPVADRAVEPMRDNMGYQLHWHVPIDDYSHWKYTIIFRYEGKIDRDFQKHKMHDNVDEEYRTPRRAENRYMQDRTEMSKSSYAGMGRKYYDHDKFATESQGRIADRSKEHLGLTDKAVVAMRKQIFQAIEDVSAGKAPLLARGDVPDPLSELRVWVGIVPADELTDEWSPPAPVRASQVAEETVQTILAKG
jgi:phenylpropionate dioxygenase-like ring-hydroxylating dioxygenase large terminal subunit